MIIYIYCGVLTDGTPFSSAHAYKAERGGGRGGVFFDMGQQKSQRLQGPSPLAWS